ncbi:hypothetical protein ACFQ48_00535 [Hymenobacter caeli]|uniref:Uncharacterized protein n=1 Tax=Hymenobacter caeli TaxID=2735894 RepID=A0ABX2FJL6_9BACT|nr:hypothetical protein [Hymenobacter caeli]NRT17305.1 hypothetical protein [Hymenobacter caeli]
MDVKYLSDEKGKITGVFIAIADWEQLQKQYGIVLTEPAAAATQFQRNLAGALAKAGPQGSDTP